MNGGCGGICGVTVFVMTGAILATGFAGVGTGNGATEVGGTTMPLTVGGCASWL